MEEEGLRILLEAKKITGLPIVTEVMSVELVEKITRICRCFANWC